MRPLALAAFAISLLGSSAAFADAIVVGTAHIPPVFAVPSGNSSLVADVGNAAYAPVFAFPSGNTGDTIEIGTAHIAPVFAQHYGPATEAQLASGQPVGAVSNNY
jgi:hypothetical protein